MSKGAVLLTVSGNVAHVVLDRPTARNAMTWAMYEQLGSVCVQLAANPALKAVTFEGAGGEAFVAGTDIEQFLAFQSGEPGGQDGVAYEQKIDHLIGLIEALPMPTVALVSGWAVGGGLAMATACDFRIATPQSRFGVPIAKTLGNCLSVANLSRLVAAWGMQRVKRMLLLAELVTADEAQSSGFLHQVVERAELTSASTQLCERLTCLAPVTQRVSKEALRRLTAANLPSGEDLVRQAYGSLDFREGVAAFVGKRLPVWQGR